jgi:hypothetical protein
MAIFALLAGSSWRLSMDWSAFKRGLMAEKMTDRAWKIILAAMLGVFIGSLALNGYREPLADPVRGEFRVP